MLMRSLYEAAQLMNPLSPLLWWCKMTHSLLVLIDTHPCNRSKWRAKRKRLCSSALVLWNLHLCLRPKATWRWTLVAAMDINDLSRGGCHRLRGAQDVLCNQPWHIYMLYIWLILMLWTSWGVKFLMHAMGVIECRMTSEMLANRNEAFFSSYKTLYP